MRRLPIRIKLTLGFGVAIALVLAATGLFLYLRLAAGLDAIVNQGLRSRAGDVTALVQQADTGLAQGSRGPLTERGESFAQILDRSGRIVDATPQIRHRALLRRAEIPRALKSAILLDRGPQPGLDRSSRLLATSAIAQDQRLIIVVGTSLEERHNALRSLGTQLLIGGPAALLLALAIGYALAAAALRPVESMRRRAAAISLAEPGQRLPVPPARDEIHRLGQTLNDMLARLEAAFARERIFVSDASHELRTPLAILKAELELALRAGRSVDELHQALRSAVEETDRLAQLAEDLLVIARSDQGRLPVRLTEIDAANLLESTRARVSKRASQLGRSIEVESEPGLTLVVDPLRVEQALGNMLNNALRHGGGPVTLAARRSGAGVELHVADRGSGFPDGFAESAFERFSRADTARGRGGAGLGLAIVAAIAGAHGGSARAENRPDGGADVWLVLPAG